MSSIILLVEGNLDKMVMSQIVPVGVLPLSGNGKMDMPGQLKGYRSATKSRAIFGFRDRDFDAPFPVKEELELKGDVLWAYRRTIENYLLLPDNLEAFIAERGEPMRRIFGGKPAQEVIADAALHIRHYQIARAALGEVRRRNPLGSTWLNDSDQLPAILTKDGCFHAGQDYLREHLANASIICDPNIYLEKFDNYAALYTDGFIARGGHLVAFSGKNLCKSVSAQYPKFPMKTFLEATASRFKADGFADLQRMVNLLTEKLR